jgi:4-diphosphocytidyl-2-C-methyl-D-erythritol kinase
MTSKDQFEIIGDGLLVRAPAKINLSLLIAGKRPDGFHEIDTIMAKVNFYDQLLIERGKKKGVEFVCDGPQWAPEGEENLVHKAAEMLLKSCGRMADIKITLAKNIPAELAGLAVKLGSDTAFFLDGPLARCGGKGEKIEKLDEKFALLALLILPDVSVPTKKVYANYLHNPALYNELSARINDFMAENRIDLAAKMCANMLETSCLNLNKELADLKAEIESLGLVPLCLSGSGSSMFYIVDNSDVREAEENKCKLEKNIGCKAVLVSNNRW